MRKGRAPCGQTTTTSTAQKPDDPSTRLCGRTGFTGTNGIDERSVAPVRPPWILFSPIGTDDEDPFARAVRPGGGTSL